MIVVPVKGDRITTKDTSEELVVSSYTNLKSEPAVYIKGNTPDSYIGFSNIDEINGIKVEFNSSTKMFDTLGPLKRRINLPQPGDSIQVKTKDSVETMKIKSVKLHDRSKKSFGMIVKTDEDLEFDLAAISSIDAKNEVEGFNLGLFKRYYLDYYPINK